MEMDVIVLAKYKYQRIVATTSWIVDNNVMTAIQFQVTDVQLHVWLKMVMFANKLLIILVALNVEMEPKIPTNNATMEISFLMMDVSNASYLLVGHALLTSQLFAPKL